MPEPSETAALDVAEILRRLTLLQEGGSDDRQG